MATGEYGLDYENDLLLKAFHRIDELKAENETLRAKGIGMTGRLIDMVLEALRDKSLEDQRSELRKLRADIVDLLKPVWPEREREAS